MDTAWWISLGLTAWSVGSVPLALVVGRALRTPEVPRPTPRGTTAPVLAA
jgi:hypothetical protein